MRLTEILSVDDIIGMTAKALEKSGLFKDNIELGQKTIWVETNKGLMLSIMINDFEFLLSVRGHRYFIEAGCFDSIQDLIEAILEINKKPSKWLEANDIPV